MKAGAAALRHDRGPLRALTGIRAVAAVAVVVFHYRDQIYGRLPAARAAEPVLGAGYLGVDLFFALSGFILAYNYSHRLGDEFRFVDVARFLWLRIARVWPVHFFTLNVMLAAFIVSRMIGLTLNTEGQIRHDAWAYLENVFMVHAWFGEGLSFNAPAWSISAEWFAYLLFLVLVLATSRIGGARVAVLGAVGSYVAFAGTYGVWYAEDPQATKGALLRVGFEFLAGCLLFEVYKHARPSENWGAGAVAAALGAVLVAGVTDGSRLQPILVPPLLGILVLCLALSSGPVRLVLSTSVAVFAGEASYSLYMTHEIVHPVVNKLMPPTAFGESQLVVRLALLVGLFVAAAAAAVATYLLVEKPARDLLRRAPFTTDTAGSRPQ